MELNRINTTTYTAKENSTKNLERNQNTVQSFQDVFQKNREVAAKDTQNLKNTKVNSDDSRESTVSRKEEPINTKEKESSNSEDKGIHEDKTTEKSDKKSANVKEDKTTASDKTVSSKEVTLEELETALKGDKGEASQWMALLAMIVNGKVSLQDVLSNTEGTSGQEILKILEPSLKDALSNNGTLKEGVTNPVLVQIKNVLMQGSEPHKTADSNAQHVAIDASLIEQKGNAQQGMEQIIKLLVENDTTLKNKPEMTNKIQELMLSLLENPTKATKAIKTDLQKEIFSALKVQLEGKEEPQKNLISKIEKPLNTENQGMFNLKDGGAEEEESTVSAEDKLLKSLLTEEKDNKINKATTFMTQFSAIKESPMVTTLADKAVIDRANFTADIIKTVKYMQTNELKDLTVKIMPKELGQIIIKLTVENGVMKANISASNKETYALLNANLQDINEKLNNSTVKIQNFSVNIYNGDTTFFKQGNSGDQNTKEQSKRVAAAEEMEEDTVGAVEESKDNSNVNILA